MHCKSLIVLALLALATPASAQFYLYGPDAFDAVGGWTFVGPAGVTEWAIGPATAGGGGSGNPDPGTDATGSLGNGVAGVVIGGDASTTPHTYDYLVSPAVDTTGLAAVFVEFQRWLNSDYPPFMSNVIDVWDGTAWVTIDGPFPPGGTSLYESAWSLQSYDASAYSNAAFQVRIGFDVASGVFSVSSWNIDDFAIVDPQLWDATIACNPIGNSVLFQIVNGTPGNSFYIATAAVSTGVIPNGWFYGVDITFAELVAQVQLGNPFVGLIGAGGTFVFPFPVPPGCGTFGIPLDYVGLEHQAGTTALLNISTPKSVTL